MFTQPWFVGLVLFILVGHFIWGGYYAYKVLSTPPKEKISKGIEKSKYPKKDV